MSARVLIVDDDELMRESLEMAAEEAGYQVAGAASGPEAIELARQRSFDLVVCDIRMPGMNGLDALSEIRRHLPEARAIVITGYASPDTPITALKLKVDDYLLKPFDGHVFLASLKRVLEDYRRRAIRPQPGSTDQLFRLLDHLQKHDHGPLAARAAGLAGRLGFSPQRSRLVYLAALLHDLEPRALASWPGLQRLATVVAAFQTGSPALLEARLVMAAADPQSADPELAEMLEEIPDQVELALEDTTSFENLVRLADKHRELGRWVEADELYQRATQLADGQFEQVARIHQAQVRLWQSAGQPERAAGRARQLLEYSRTHRLDLVEAESLVQLARLGQQVDLVRARELFTLWEDEAGLSRLEQPPPQERLKIFLFGGFEVTRDGQVLPEDAFPSRKDRKLLAYLAAHLGQMIHEEVLMEQFWPRGGPRARHSLQNSVSQIRKALGEEGRDALERGPEGYRLAHLWVDVDQFEKAYQRGREAAREHRWEEALAQLQQAERLARGDFLAGAFEEWGGELRLRLADQLTECRNLLAAYFRQRGKLTQAVEWWERVLLQDNCCEAAYQGLMECYVALELRAEAVRTYHACVRAFKAELDLPPPSELARLYFELTDF
ncbi:MAG: response regulator [Vulcanimicrobiota bacterium]